MRRTSASNKASGKGWEGCPTPVPTPAPTAPFSVYGADQRTAEGERVAQGRRSRTLISASPDEVQQCYVACSAFVGGQVPFFFDVEDVTGDCYCYRGECALIYARFFTASVSIARTRAARTSQNVYPEFITSVGH